MGVPEGAEGVAGGDAEEHAEGEADGTIAAGGASGRCWAVDCWVWGLGARGCGGSALGLLCGAAAGCARAQGFR